MAHYKVNQSHIVTLIATLAPLTLIAVVLRFVARWLTRARYGAEDWLAIISLLSVYAYMVVLLWGMRGSVTPDS